MKMKILLNAFLLFLSSSVAFGQFTFSDNASNSAYSSGWTNLSNGGNGYNDWVISSGGSDAGTFIGNPAGANVGTANIGNPAFALYGHNGQYVNARRYFGRNAVDARMQIGDSFSFWWGMNWDAGSGNKGFDLKAGGTTVFNVNNNGNAVINTTNGVADPNYGTDAMLVTLTRTSWTEYSFTMTRRSNTAQTYSTTINSSLAIDNIDIYCGAQPDGNGFRNIFFNNFTFIKADPYEINGAVTEPRILAGSSDLTKTGDYTLTLTAANTYTGMTIIYEGTLELNRVGGGTLVASNDVNVDGGTLHVRSNQTLNDLSINSGGLIVDAGATLTISGSFSSSGGQIENNGTIVLTGMTSFPGNESVISAMNNLAINSVDGITLDQNLTIDGNLVLINGLLSLGDNSLELNGTLSGGSASSYINTDGSGMFMPRVDALGANTFPVGANGVYAPITLNFTAANFGSDPRLLINTGAGTPSELHSSNTNFVDRSWSVEPQDITDFTYDIQFTYSDDELTSGTDENDLIPAKFSGGAWYKPVGSSFTDGIEQGTASLNTALNTITWSGLTTFSVFLNLQNQANPLPVKLTSFNAHCNASEVELKWSTASEFNASHFDVQMSRDGQTWNSIGEVAAAGTTNQATSYSFKTAKASTVTYFRLVQVDFDGKSEIYGPIAASCNLEKNIVSLFPNPSTEQTTIDVQSVTSEMATIQVVDLMGKVLFTQNMNLEAGSNQVVLKTNAFQTGTYLVRVIGQNNEFEVVRLVVR